jgi:hypothetical protein
MEKPEKLLRIYITQNNSKELEMGLSKSYIDYFIFKLLSVFTPTFGHLRFDSV